MRPFSKLTFIACLVVPFTFVSQAQEAARKKVRVNFSKFTINQVVEQLQSQSTLRFYFDSTEFKATTFTHQADSVEIRILLEQLLKGTEFRFAVDPETSRVFLTRGYAVQTTLPRGFWQNQASGVVSSGEDFVLQKPREKNNLKGAEESNLIQIGVSSGNPSSEQLTLAGYVRDGKNGEPIYGATVAVDSTGGAVTTDQFGYYAISMPRGRHSVFVSSASMKEVKRQIILNANGKLDFELVDNIVSLNAVVVTSETKSNVRSTQMGTAKLNIRTIKQVPVVFGETDIIKVVLALPGVTSVGEASTGFNVRGGSTDQNLILFNDATIYNPSHLFGFFSAFNPDVVKGIELYKSAIPEKYGGRLSSVLDVSVKEGNNKKWSGFAGAGPLTTKFTIEGPLKKEKTSVILGGRTTYSNWLLRSLKNNAYNKSKASFNDLNLHISTTLNAHNSLYVTGYWSNDRFKLNTDTTYVYSNKNANIKWKHIFSNKVNAVATVGADQYNYAVSSTSIPVNGYKLGFSIDQKYVRGDFNFAPNNTHSVSFGINSIYYQLRPGYFQPKGAQSLVVPNTVTKEHGLETAVYLGDIIKISSAFSLNAGLRYSLFNFLGPHDVYSYVPAVPRSVNTITDTTSYGAKKAIKTYHGPEVRLALRYAFAKDASFKLSYNTLRQYIHMLSNTTAISPTDIWKLSDPYIAPQEGQQLSLGFYKDFKSKTIETSVEIYYKRMNNYLDYKSGASLVLNHHIETETINTKGKSYGIEFLIKKSAGKINGWVSYTYSRTFLKQDDPIAGEDINNGRYYPASFDKPHNVNVIGNYRLSHRYSASTNFVYSTGRPITLPLAIFTTGGASSLYYSNRNEFRIPDYIRMDFSINIDGNHNVKQKTHNSWSFGVYNLFARQNAYSIYFINENGRVKGYQLSIFGTAIPFVTFNLRF